jgi:membrane-associated phospholipid phosphatase
MFPQKHPQVTVQPTVAADAQWEWLRAGLFTAGFVGLSAVVWRQPRSVWGEGTVTNAAAWVFINADVAYRAIWFGGVRAMACAFVVAAAASLYRNGFRGVLTAPWVTAGAAGVTTCALVQEVLKPTIGRTSEGWDMFPSGHAAGAMTAGALLWCAADALGPLRKLGRGVAVTWAAVGVLAPVAVRSHYPTDALGSVLCFAAVLSAGVTLRAHGTRRFAARRQSRSRPEQLVSRSEPLQVL